MSVDVESSARRGGKGEEGLPGSAGWEKLKATNPACRPVVASNRRPQPQRRRRLCSCVPERFALGSGSSFQNRAWGPLALHSKAIALYQIRTFSSNLTIPGRLKTNVDIRIARNVGLSFQLRLTCRFLASDKMKSTSRSAPNDCESRKVNITRVYTVVKMNRYVMQTFRH